jgi:prephenate dehydratase
MKRIAIQGVLGSFHDIAAHQYFEGEQIQLICCATFEEVFENIQRDPTVIGMLAIENTIAGSLLHNYELLRASGATVVGEHKLHIQHSICCLPEDDWDTISEVHSHPVALMQCREFWANHASLKAVEAEDTAGSAEFIKKNDCRGWAAICHSTAAEMYGMKVLEDHIEDNKHNYTRFLVACNPNKADFLRPIEKIEQVQSGVLIASRGRKSFQGAHDTLFLRYQLDEDTVAARHRT